MRRLAVGLALVAVAVPALARDALGVFEGWGAFRDAEPSRCYAIAEPEESSDLQPFATIAWWPQKETRGQVHFRLSRERRPDADVFLLVGTRKWRMVAGKADAWSPSPQHDAFILAKMRAARAMHISTVSRKGNNFSDVYDLQGAASAMDAAALGCAKPAQ